MTEDRRAHDRIDKIDTSIQEINNVMTEHTIYIKEYAELQRKNSKDIDLIKEDLRANRDFNERSAEASERSAKASEELITLFQGSKNIIAAGKYFSALFVVVGVIVGALITVFNYSTEIINFILHRGK